MHRRIDVIPGAKVPNPRTAARAVGHVAGHIQHAPSTTRRLRGALRGALFEIVGAADVARIAKRAHGLRRRVIPRTPEPARVISHGMTGGVVLQPDQANVGRDVAVVDHELGTLASAQLNTPYGALPLLYPGANDQPPIQLLFDRFQQQCAAVTMMLFPLMTDAEQVPLLVNNLPIGAVCARAVPPGIAAKITAATDKSAHLERYDPATIAASPLYKIRPLLRINSSHPDGACGLLSQRYDSARLSPMIWAWRFATSVVRWGSGCAALAFPESSSNPRASH